MTPADIPTARAAIIAAVDRARAAGRTLARSEVERVASLNGPQSVAFWTGFDGQGMGTFSQFFPYVHALGRELAAYVFGSSEENGR